MTLSVKKHLKRKPVYLKILEVRCSTRQEVWHWEKQLLQYVKSNINQHPRISKPHLAVIHRMSAFLLTHNAPLAKRWKTQDQKFHCATLTWHQLSHRHRAVHTIILLLFSLPMRWNQHALLGTLMNLTLRILKAKDSAMAYYFISRAKSVLLVSVAV